MLFLFFFQKYVNTNPKHHLWSTYKQNDWGGKVISAETSACCAEPIRIQSRMAY